MISLIQTTKLDLDLANDMENHYSAPKGFVGRSICYKVYHNFIYYGAIVGGSATRFLPGRDEFFNTNYNNWDLNNIINNLFFHIEKKNGSYPTRNFSQEILNLFVSNITKDWYQKYDDKVLGFETLIELPRTGEIYKRNKWTLVGQTKGFTCKRVAGRGTDSWSGKRVWNTVDLKPKLVFTKIANA